MQNMLKSYHVIFGTLPVCRLQYAEYAEYGHANDNTTIILHNSLNMDAYCFPCSGILFHIFRIFLYIEILKYAEYGHVTIILHIILHVCAY